MIRLYEHNHFGQKVLNDIFYSNQSGELNRQILFQIVRFTDAFDLDCKEHTFGHSVRVMHYAVQLAGYLHFDPKTQRAIMNGARFHDIGKIGIPPAILLKKEALSYPEYQLIKRHPEIGGDILRHFPEFHTAIKGVLYHHERFDGSGYPYGLKGDEIPIEAQIIALSDTFDALTVNRPYRKALSPELAIEILRHQTKSGKWNPYLYAFFEKTIRMTVRTSLPKSFREKEMPSS